MRGRIEITGSNIPRRVLSSLLSLRRVGQTAKPPHPLFLSHSLGFDKITSTIHDSPGTPMDFPLYPPRRKETAVPLAFQPRREFFEKFTTTATNSRETSHASTLICNCTYTSSCRLFLRGFSSRWGKIVVVSGVHCSLLILSRAPFA